MIEDWKCRFKSSVIQHSQFVIAVIFFVVTIGITVFNVPETSTKKSIEKTSLKQAFKLLIKNDQMIRIDGSIDQHLIFVYKNSKRNINLLF